jgi:hypothetical protein
VFLLFIALNSLFLAMRVLVLDEPTVIKSTGGDNNEAGICFTIGDRVGNKASCFVRIDPDDSEEKEALSELKTDCEALIFCAAVTNNGKFCCFLLIAHILY